MKAVLVIDEMPKDCYDCTLCTEDEIYGKHTFICIGYNAEIEDIGAKAEWCPLRQLPSYKAVDLNDTRDVVMFCHGWNTCLAEITGETE